MPMLLLIAALFSSIALGQPITLPKDRVIELTGMIDTEHLLITKRLLSTRGNTEHPVYLVIDSPGGRLDVGAAIVLAIETLKNHGVPVICVVRGGAASMAFSILGHCSARYALPDATLMYHLPGVVVKGTLFLNRNDCLDLAESIKPAEEEMIQDIAGFLHMSPLLVRQIASKSLTQTPEQINAASPGFIQVVSSLEVK